MCPHNASGHDIACQAVRTPYLLYDCLSYLNLIGQLEGNIARIARSLLPVPIMTRKSKY